MLPSTCTYQIFYKKPKYFFNKIYIITKKTSLHFDIFPQNYPLYDKSRLFINKNDPDKTTILSISLCCHIYLLSDNYILVFKPYGWFPLIWYNKKIYPPFLSALIYLLPHIYLIFNVDKKTLPSASMYFNIDRVQLNTSTFYTHSII